MCETHYIDDRSWIRRKVLNIMAGNTPDMLRFYMDLATWTRIPIIGYLFKFLCEEYGRYYHGGKVYTLKHCLDFVEQAASVTVVECACRKTFNNCQKTTHNCLTINTTADVMIGKSEKNPKKLSPKEAEDVLRRSHKEGLLHVIHHCIAPNEYAICSCCSCCCVPLRQRMDYGIVNAVLAGDRQAQADNQKCISCNNCVQICPVGALTGYFEEGGEGVLIDLDKCLGCGLCIDSCPVEALCLVERSRITAQLITHELGKWQKSILYFLLFIIIFPIAWAHKLINKPK